MLILAIESSCDETSASLVQNGNTVLSCEIASSVLAHASTKGIVPEVAARDHVVKMTPTLSHALEKSGVVVDDIDAIAVVNGPGLVGSLLSGVGCAQALAYAWQKPLIPVHHIIGHIYANWLERSDEEISLPALVLTASGGHNELVLLRAHGDFEMIGETLDDACGEAFDKVARILDLGFPGGPAISQAALSGARDAYPLPRPMQHSGDYNFSFSGLKTAVSRLVDQLHTEYGNTLPSHIISDVAASFETACIESLIHKLRLGAEEYGVREIHLSGGVSANSYLRDQAARVADESGLVLRFPTKMLYCTDNASMIGAAAFYSPRNNSQDWRDTELDLNFDI